MERPPIVDKALGVGRKVGKYMIDSLIISGQAQMGFKDGMFAQPEQQPLTDEQIAHDRYMSQFQDGG